MNTAVVITKTEPEVKAKAQKIAKELGFSLSSLVNAYLRQLVKTKTITFSSLDETPNKKTRAIMKQAEKNWKEEKHSPIFRTGEDAVAWLEKQGI